MMYPHNLFCFWNISWRPSPPIKQSCVKENSNIYTDNTYLISKFAFPPSFFYLWQNFNYIINFKLQFIITGRHIFEPGSTSTATTWDSRHKLHEYQVLWDVIPAVTFNACVKSVLLYGCETWLVTNEIVRKIQTFVNRCLWYILRIWWPNIISNKDLWKVTGQEDINLEIRKWKFRSIGHTSRKVDGEIPKAALLWNPQGNSKRGRLKNTWRRSIIKEAGRSWNELSFLAADRQKWKGLTDNLCS